MPEKYNGPGQRALGGSHLWLRVSRAYSAGGRPRVYHGVWGAAPFQSLYEPAPSPLAFLPQMPEWHLMTVTLAGMAGLSVVYQPLKLAFPLFVGALVLPIAQAYVSAVHARFPAAPAGVPGSRGDC